MRVLVCLTLLPLFAFGAQPDAPPGLDLAVAAHVKKKNASETPVFRSMPVALNGDEFDDAVVLLTNPEWCGSGGCTLLVFRGTAQGFQFVSSSTVTNTPIRVTDEKHEGWRTLIVHARGTGEVALQFDGNRYPGNPSMQPVAKPALLQNAKVLLE